MQSTYLHNKEVLELVLSGKNYRECAAEYETSTNSIMLSVRYVLDALEEHADIPVEVCGVYDYVIKNKETILKYLQYPIPTVSITKKAKAYLREKFGKQYASVPEKVAQDWENSEEHFNAYGDKRHRVSIQRWLSSVGYLAGDYVDDAMREFACQSITETMGKINGKEKKLGFKVTSVERSEYSKPDLYIWAELQSGEHVVKRRFSLELLDY